jgi:hypothetical protein
VHKAVVERTSFFPGRIHTMTFVTGMQRADDGNTDVDVRIELVEH